MAFLKHWVFGVSRLQDGGLEAILEVVVIIEWQLLPNPGICCEWIQKTRVGSFQGQANLCVGYEGVQRKEIDIFFLLLLICGFWLRNHGIVRNFFPVSEEVGLFSLSETTSVIWCLSCFLVSAQSSWQRMDAYFCLFFSLLVIKMPPKPRGSSLRAKWLGLQTILPTPIS